jgi:hydroxymethylbilane synthase
MTALVASVNGRRLIRDSIQGLAQAAYRLGIELAERLLAQGGEEILRDIYGTAPS